MKGKYKCPRCGTNDWTPQTWGDTPSDRCNECGYEFTSSDVPDNSLNGSVTDE